MGAAESRVDWDVPKDDTVYIVASAPGALQDRLRAVAAASKYVTTGRFRSKQFIVCDLLYSERKYGAIEGWKARWKRDVTETLAAHEAKHGKGKVIILAVFDKGTNWAGWKTKVRSEACAYERRVLNEELEQESVRRVHWESNFVKNAVILNS